MAKEKPQYKHDFGNRVFYIFLGHFSFEDDNYDLYACTEDNITTVIARFSDMPGDYLSSFLRCIGDCTGEDPALHEARRRLVKWCYMWRMSEIMDYIESLRRI